MNYLLHLPAWLCGFIIVGAFVLIAVAGLPIFRRLTSGHLRLTDEMNNDIIFFASAISSAATLAGHLSSVSRNAGSAS